MKPEIWNACQRYLNRLGEAEYKRGLAAHLKAGRKRSTYRHTISEYHRDLVRMLGNCDEQGFKALKMLQGDHSALGV